MKIDDVFLTTFGWDVPHGAYPGSAIAYGGERQMGVLTIRTDEGLEGHSFLGSASRDATMDAEALLTLLKPIIMGENPLDIGRFWHAMWKRRRGVSFRAIGAVDVALWDLAGKIAGLPVHRLLGSCRSSVPAYASSASLPSPEAYAEEARSFQDRGWTGYKIHPDTRPSVDIDICRAVREGVGPDMTLMLDSVWAYSYEDAVRVGRAIEDLDYYWYEDPLEEEDIYGYVKLRQKLDIPILATEFAPASFYGLQQWVQQQATDILRGDVAVSGGITALHKIANLADAFRMKCEVHHGGNSLNNVANLHVIMAVQNCEFFEVLLPDAAQKYGLVNDIEVDADGLVHAPEEPGLGYEIDWDLVRSRQVSELR